MKKVLLAVLGLFLFAGAAQAQEFKPFKIGVGLGYAIPGGEGAGGGVLIYGEPAYRLKDEIAVGLRIESALVVRGFEENVEGYTGDIAGISSYTLNGQYYFSNGGFRPLAGIGLGLYSLSAVSLGTGDAAAGNKTTFGFYPRIGFDAGHFNFLMEYNLIPTTEVESFDGEKMKVKNSYFAIKAGVSILGGRR